MDFVFYSKHARLEYDRRTMQFLEKIEKKVNQTNLKLKEIGKVFIYDEAVNSF